MSAAPLGPMSRLQVLVLPGPWVHGATGVGHRQDAGVRCGGYGRPAVGSRENLQISAGAFYQSHFGERTTVQWTEHADPTKMATRGMILGPDTAVAALQGPMSNRLTNTPCPDWT